MGFANFFILGEHHAFSDFGLTLKASALVSASFGVVFTIGVANSLILFVAVEVKIFLII